MCKPFQHALGKKISKKTTSNKEHWLDHADDKYDPQLIADIKATLKVLFLYIPLPVFWALFDQQVNLNFSFFISIRCNYSCLTLLLIFLYYRVLDGHSKQPE